MAATASPGPLAGASLVAFAATIDPARLRAFYEGVFGLRLIADEPFALVFDAGSVQLRMQKVVQFDPQPHTVLGWSVSDVAGTVARWPRVE